MAFTRAERLALHKKQERLQVKADVPRSEDLTEGVPTLRTTEEGLVEYVRHNNQLYKKVYVQADAQASKVGVPDYSSGWFAANKNEAHEFDLSWTYTNITLPRVQIWFNDGSTNPAIGTDQIWQISDGNDVSNVGFGAWIRYDGTSSIKVYTGEDYLFNMQSTIDQSFTTGYLLVQVWKVKEA
ncbi:MAG: hypothetical protein CMI54_01950 [Parcubacteria group bacterium]|jgi:hypothetical protein|nr:hypothetical protein [Parcubacteria group bacterium]|tara:strand:+ start:5628 stop:6176 length:549 start_codon:yes stop_codon:yes gene_type:complete